MRAFADEVAEKFIDKLTSMYDENDYNKPRYTRGICDYSRRVDTKLGPMHIIVGLNLDTSIHGTCQLVPNTSIRAINIYSPTFYDKYDRVMVSRLRSTIEHELTHAIDPKLTPEIEQKSKNWKKLNDQNYIRLMMGPGGPIQKDPELFKQYYEFPHEVDAHINGIASAVADRIYDTGMQKKQALSLIKKPGDLPYKYIMSTAYDYYIANKEYAKKLMKALIYYIDKRYKDGPAKPIYRADIEITSYGGYSYSVSYETYSYGTHEPWDRPDSEKKVEGVDYNFDIRSKEEAQKFAEELAERLKAKGYTHIRIKHTRS